MSAGIGIAIEQSKAGPVAGDDQICFVIVGLGDLRKKGRICAGALWRENILDAPGGVQRFHRGSVKGAWKNVKTPKKLGRSAPVPGRSSGDICRPRLKTPIAQKLC